MNVDRSILIVGLHVYLMQKLIKLLEEEGDYVIAVFSSDMIGKNLRMKQFDFVLINTDVKPRLKQKTVEAVNRYQNNCTILNAIYDKSELLEILS